MSSLAVTFAGVRMRTPRVCNATLGTGQWLLMHSDGVSRPRELPNGNAQSVAKQLMASCAHDNDDSAILVLRWLEKNE